MSVLIRSLRARFHDTFQYFIENIMPLQSLLYSWSKLSQLDEARLLSSKTISP